MALTRSGPNAPRFANVHAKHQVRAHRIQSFYTVRHGVLRPPNLQAIDFMRLCGVNRIVAEHLQR